MNHKQFEEIPARSRQYSWYLRYNPLYMEVSMGQIIDVGFSIAMLPILLILYMEVFYNGTNHIIDVGCIAMLPQGSKACAELLRAQEGRPMFWRESSTGISVAAFFTARALGDSAWDRCDVRRKWAGYGWIYYTYATYVHQHVLIDVKICWSFFLGLNQLNIYPFRFSLHGGSTINRQVLSSAEEISLMCSCCAVPTSCTLTGRMLCLRKLTEMLVSAKFSQKIYKRIFGL